VEIALLTILFVFICLQICLLITILNISSSKKKVVFDENLPFISILVAARNEKDNIISCLKSLSLLDYPKNKLEILIGNDHSTDETENLVLEFVKNNACFRLINIQSNLGKARAKANVLAHLFRESRGEIIFVTDADIRVKSTWIKSLLPKFSDKQVGVVSGITVVEGNTFFTKMQGVDWLYYMGLLVAFDKLGFKGTAVGNNMAILKEAYLSTGGYENLTFSVTEDLALYKAVLQNGYKGLNVMEQENTNFSKPQVSFMQFLHQRKRWLIGAKGLSYTWKTLIILIALFYPFLFLVSFFSLKNALAIWVCKFLLQSLSITFVANKIAIKKSLTSLVLFEIYSLVVSILIAFFYVFPVKMTWKDRQFNNE
jgi:cellulose synthase/poly-beta-1,6-N-acetylglucosamine synthase-like glycosyltransferase